MAKKKPTATERLFSCMNLSRNVVDRGDMVHVNRMTQSEARHQRRNPKQHRLVVEGGEDPDPHADVEHGKDAVCGSEARLQVRQTSVKEPHDGPSRQRAGRSPSPPRSNSDHGKGSVAAIAGLAVDRSSSRRGG
jgi:hypothetical protein